MTPRTRFLALALALAAFSATATAANAPMTVLLSLPRTDFVNVGVGGIGAAAINGGGSGTLELVGVSGTVTQAWLYWEGIDIDWAAYQYTGGDANYDVASVMLDGTPVTGTRLHGQGANNGWPFLAIGQPPPPPSAALYRADVTGLIQAGGNHAYALGGLAIGAGHSANGASLIVYFDDGDPTNDKRVVHYDGMQSNDGARWTMPFTVDYQGGAVEAIFHVADGQASLDDGELEFRVTPGIPGSNTYSKVEFAGTHFDGQPLWAGMSVPGMGFGRSSGGPRLWDIRRLPLGSAFAAPGSYATSIEFDGAQDALSLLVAQIVQPADADPQNLMLTPAPFDFGDVVRDSVGPSQTFTLRNLLPHAITIAATPTVYAAMYQVTAQTCSGQTLAPGATCTVEVACAPTGLGQAPDSALQVKWTPPSNFVQRTAYAPLACYGVRAAQFSRLALTPTQCAFGQLPSGTTSAPRHFVASNTGTLPLSITQVRIPASARFSVSSESCNGLTMQPGESCPVAVVFSPTQGGNFSSTLGVYFSASDDTETVLSTLTGSGTSATSDAVFRSGFDPLLCD